MTAQVDEVVRALELAQIPVTVEVCTALVSWSLMVCILTGVDVEEMIMQGRDCFQRCRPGDGTVRLSGDGQELSDRVLEICTAFAAAEVCPIQNVGAMYYFGLNGLKKNGLGDDAIEGMLRMAYESSARRIAIFTIEQNAGVN